MTSLYELAEKCKYRIGGGDYQALMSFVVDAYASVVKNAFYENKTDGIAEIDGEFIYTFGKKTDLTPVLDDKTNEYYIDIPSSYVRLPHEYGINSVSYMMGQQTQFIRVMTGSYGMWQNIKAGVLGGRQTYYVEGAKMYFPKMTAFTKANILLKIAIGLDTADIDEPLNISRDLVDQIVNMVVAKFVPQKEKLE